MQTVSNYIIISKYKDWYEREFGDNSWRLELMSYLQDRAIERWDVLKSDVSSLKEYKMFKHEQPLDQEPWDDEDDWND